MLSRCAVCRTEDVCETPPHSQTPGLSGQILLWGVFFLICLGLGYPTLNRYDPRHALPDSAHYAKLVTDGPRQVEGYFRFRVLEPYLVRPLYRLAKGRVGSRDPLFSGFLVVNSFFVAGVAYLTSVVGYAHLRSYPVALFGAALYLLNFASPNAQLAGLVDAGEAFFLIALVASMYFERWWLLPIFSVLGTLTKESFVPFSLTMGGTWWLYSRASGRHRTWGTLWIAVMPVVEFATMTVLQSSVTEQLTWPWNFALGLNTHFREYKFRCAAPERLQHCEWQRRRAWPIHLQCGWPASESVGGEFSIPHQAWTRGLMF
jgi:hypothetical protein